MKWLIEITRTTLQNLLKEKIQQIPIGAPAKTDKPLAAVPIRVINKVGLTNLRSRSVSKPNANTNSTSKNNPITLYSSPKNDDLKPQEPHEKEIIIEPLNIKQTSATVNFIKDDSDTEENTPQQQQRIPSSTFENENLQTHTNTNTNTTENETETEADHHKERPSSPFVNNNIEIVMNDNKPSAPSQAETMALDTTAASFLTQNINPALPNRVPTPNQNQTPVQNQHHQQQFQNSSREQVRTVVLNHHQKHIKKNPFIYNIEGSLVQLYYGNINSVNNYSNLVEDLDIVQASYAYQFLPPKNPRNSKIGTFVTLDMDRRKEFINKVFKDLYARNEGIEKHAAAFQADLLQERIWSYPHPTNVRKGENFCENITLNFPKMFPHLIPDEETNTDSIPLKGKYSRAMNPNRNRKKSDTTGAPHKSTSHHPNSNHKGGRSESSYDNRSQRKSYMDILLNKIQNKNTGDSEDTAANYSSVNNNSSSNPGPNPNFGYRTENRFRIMKKKMSVYPEVKEYSSPHKTQRAKASTHTHINSSTQNKLMTEASGIFTPEHLNQAMAEMLNYLPNMSKEISDSAQKQKDSTHTPSYSIYSGTRSTSINKIRPNPTPTPGAAIGGEYTIWDSLNQSKIVMMPEKVSKRPKNKNENFSLLHANDIIQAANPVGYDSHRISPHSNRIEKTKR